MCFQALFDFKLFSICKYNLYIDREEPGVAWARTDRPCPQDGAVRFSFPLKIKWSRLYVTGYYTPARAIQAGRTSTGPGPGIMSDVRKTGRGPGAIAAGGPGLLLSVVALQLYNARDFFILSMAM